MSAPIPVPFLCTLDFGLDLGPRFGTWIWDLDLGPRFGTWIWYLDLGLDLGLTITFRLKIGGGSYLNVKNVTLFLKTHFSYFFGRFG